MPGLSVEQLQKIHAGFQPTSTNSGEGSTSVAAPTPQFTMDGQDYVPNGQGGFWEFKDNPAWDSGSSEANYNGQTYQNYDAQGNDIGTGQLSGIKNDDFMSKWGPFAMVGAGFGAGIAAGAGAGAAADAAASTAGGIDTAGNVLNSAVMGGGADVAGGATTAAIDAGNSFDSGVLNQTVMNGLPAEAQTVLSQPGIIDKIKSLGSGAASFLKSIGVTPSIIGAVVNAVNGGIQTNAAKSSAAQIAAGAQKASDILAPAYTDAAKLVADSRTSAASTEAGGFTTAAQQQATGDLTAGNTLADGYKYAANTEAQGATDAALTLSGGYKTAAGQQVAGLNSAQTAVDQTLASQKQLQQPWQQAGLGALSTLSSGLQSGGQFNKPFSMADMGNVMPAYKFAEGQALEAMRNQMAAGGQDLSSNAVQGAGTLASGLASQYEGQAFNQWLQQNNMTLGGLQQMVSTGQMSTNQLEAALASAGFSTQQIQTAIGAANAAGTLGAAQATATGQSTAANYQGAGLLGAGKAQSDAQKAAAAATAAGTLGSTKATAGGITGSADATAQGVLGNAATRANAAQMIGKATAAGTVAAGDATTKGLASTTDSLIGDAALKSASYTLGSGLNGTYTLGTDPGNSFDDGTLNNIIMNGT
jgi:hypothetical protein